jgi:hypothetical protein
VKLFRTNMGLFILLPAFVTVMMLGYMIVIYSQSAVFMNVINISFDGILLIYYLTNFVYQVRIDEEWVIFYSAFRIHIIKRAELAFVMPSSIMTKFVCKRRNFYILTTKNGSLVLKNMMKDIVKDKVEDEHKPKE